MTVILNVNTAVTTAGGEAAYNVYALTGALNLIDGALVLLGGGGAVATATYAAKAAWSALAGCDGEEAADPIGFYALPAIARGPRYYRRAATALRAARAEAADVLAYWQGQAGAA